MEKSEFDRLLERYLTKNISDQEKNKLEAWLDVMKVEDTKHLELSKEDENRLYHKITSNINNLQEVISFRPQIMAKPKTDRWIWAMAASVALITTTVLLILYFQNNNQQTAKRFETNNPEKVILDDGTLVWLTSNSKLSYHQQYQPNIRHAELKGEGLFEVKKDASNPFWIHCGELTMKVVGTSFNIRYHKDSTELIVLTGNVNVTNSNQDSPIEVHHNEKLIYKLGQFEKKSASDREVTSITVNTQYNMHFADAKMEEVIQRLEEKFNVTVKVQNANVMNCIITADFTDHSLQSSLQMISEVLNVTFSGDNKSITIAGNGCE